MRKNAPFEARRGAKHHARALFECARQSLRRGAGPERVWDSSTQSTIEETQAWSAKCARVRNSTAHLAQRCQRHGRSHHAIRRVQQRRRLAQATVTSGRKFFEEGAGIYGRGCIRARCWRLGAPNIHHGISQDARVFCELLLLVNAESYFLRGPEHLQHAIVAALWIHAPRFFSLIGKVWILNRY